MGGSGHSCAGYSRAVGDGRGVTLPVLDTDRGARTETETLARLDKATTELDAPFAVIDLDAMWDNAADLERRAAGKPIRLASKSVRCRSLQARTLERAGFRGTLAFTLPEALWLATQGFDDLLVAYPTADRNALRELAGALADRPDLELTIMVDSVEHLDFIDASVGPRAQAIQICIEVDAGWRALGGRVRVGAKRSPVREVDEAVALARSVEGRDGFVLRGIMAYEAQIAGVGDAPPGQRLRGAAIRAMQSASARELATRRAEVVAAVNEIVPLEFVNAGGTGSVDRSASEDVVTEVAAGSGLFAPALFSAYRSFRPRPAAFFALPVVRKPSADVATLLGGGYLASGPADSSRLPQPYLPAGLRLDRQEGAGEVQTPVLGPPARNLSIGDRVYFRHAKSGELCERFNSLLLVEGERIVEEVPTYRGEGKAFL